MSVTVGGNDPRRYDADSYADALAAMVARLPVGPTVIADVPYFMHGHFERDAAAAAAVLRDLAGHRGQVVAGLHEQLQGQGWRAMGTSYAANWFHPNDRGHRTWQQAFGRPRPATLPCPPASGCLRRRRAPRWIRY